MSGRRHTPGRLACRNLAAGRVPRPDGRLLAPSGPFENMRAGWHSPPAARGADAPRDRRGRGARMAPETSLLTSRAASFGVARLFAGRAP